MYKSIFLIYNRSISWIYLGILMAEEIFYFIHLYSKLNDLKQN